jgi:hypothetical protein
MSFLRFVNNTISLSSQEQDYLSELVFVKNDEQISKQMEMALSVRFNYFIFVIY